MDQSVSSASSIQGINAALMAQYQAANKTLPAQTGAKAGSASFASQLQTIERKELPAPTPLYTLKATGAEAVAPQAASRTSEAKPVAEEESEPCAAPKISRSGRMACAEKATKVQEAEIDFDFDDLVDLVNPLQHIPLLGSIYRELTGDTIKTEVQVAGSIGFGLLTGSVLVSAAAGIASAVVTESTGKEPLVQVASALFGDTVQTPDPVTENKIVLADAASSASRPVAQTPVAAPQAKEFAVSSQPSETQQNAAADAATQTQPAVQQKVAAPVLASGGTRMGNTIYTSPKMNVAAKVSRSATATSESALAQVSSTKKPVEDSTLGTLIHEQAKARDAGQTLPPELVQDMMVMALDKYKAANMASADTGAAVYVQ